MHRWPLLNRLRGYFPRDGAEAQNLERLRGFVESSPGCFRRENAEGHITGSAWLLNFSKRSALLTHHKQLDKWIQLGGHADGEGDVAAVALREAREESGIEEISLLSGEIFDIDIHPIPATADAPAHFHYDIRYLAHVEGEEAFRVSAESKALKWFGMEELKTAPVDPSVLRMVFKWEDHAIAASLRIFDKIRNYAHVIWDWNGTLLNDMELCVEVVGKTLLEQGLPVPSLHAYRQTFGFPVMDYYRRLGFDFEKSPFEKLAADYIGEYNRRSVEAPLFPGTRELLERVAARGISQSLLSAAHQGHLDTLAEHFRIRPLFSNVCGLSDHYAASKVERGRELLREAGMDPKKTLLIGDTDHDAEVARALGTDCLLIADGHQTHDRLLRTGCEVLRSRYSGFEISVQ